MQSLTEEQGATTLQKKRRGCKMHACMHAYLFLRTHAPRQTLAETFSD